MGSIIRTAKICLATGVIFGLSGLAGGANADSGGLFDNFNLGDFFTYHGDKDKDKDPAAPKARHLFCPDILILEGTAASQVHAGAPPTTMNLRYQFSLGDVVRECSIEGEHLSIKVGIAGSVLLGPAGAPASFSVPLRIAIVNKTSHEPVVTKLYHAAATIAAGQAQAAFSVVSEPLLVPFFQDRSDYDYDIKVGIDEAAEAEKADKKPKH
ncbi:MAG: hypothetical protein WDN46_13265 [Methylocella sp.]